MSTTTEKAELLKQEVQFWDAMKGKNATVAGKMTDSGCIVVGAQGVSMIDPSTMSKLTEEGQWSLKRFNLDESSMQVRFIEENVAVVGYSVEEDVVVDGEPINLKANDASVWVRRDGQWVCALHTESVAGDPFGRDRRDRPMRD